VYQSAWRYALRLCANREDAEDLLQESLGHAYTKLDQLRADDTVRGWVLSIIRSKFLRHRQRAKSRSAQQSSELAEYSLAAPTDWAADPLSELMTAALSQLPESQREILSLFYIEGLSVYETGLVLNVAPQAVKQRLFRARAALRRHMQPHLAMGDLAALL
jgi:RNA polymerase sigma-70 factor (ECF subfamily)